MMQAYTEEQRAELIAELKAEKAVLEKWRDDWNARDKVNHSAICIALASLMADPVGWTDAEELRDVQRSGCGYIFSAKPVTPNADERRVLMLYTAPPVVAPAVPGEAFIDKVCLTAAGIFGQDDPDEAQEIVNRIRAMLVATPEVE